MSVVYQAVDIAVAGLVAGVSSFLLGAVAPNLAVTIGVVLASMYYFSRNPWGSSQGEMYNEQIDGLYERFLPF